MTETHFNIIDIDRHSSSIEQARSRDEGELALLRNTKKDIESLLMK